MSPALAALLFHAPGVRLLTKRKLTPLGLKLNIVAGSATVVAMLVAGMWRGPLEAFIAWAVGHTLWSITLASSVQRLTTK